MKEWDHFSYSDRAIVHSGSSQVRSEKTTKDYLNRFKQGGRRFRDKNFGHNETITIVSGYTPVMI